MEKPTWGIFFCIGNDMNLNEMKAEGVRLALERAKLRREVGEKCRESFRYFVRAAWGTADPSKPFVGNWHIDAVCDHLQAVADLEIRELVLNVPPGTAKPCYVGGMVLERTKGRIKLGDVVIGDEVLTHQGRFRKVLAVHEQGVLPVLEVSVYSGKKIVVADDHPVLTARGWVEAKDLTLDDVLAEVHAQERCGSKTITHEEARILGYLVGDGGVKYASKVFTNQNERVIEDFEACARSLGMDVTRRLRGGKNCTIYVSSLTCGDNRTREGKNALGKVRVWLRSHDMDGKDSYTKRVPASVMAGDQKIIANFLGAYWDCDGYVQRRGYASARGKDSCSIGCATVSEGLARDIQHLLTRLGVKSRLRKKMHKLISKKQGSMYTSYRVEISSFDHGTKFCSVVPLRSDKADRARMFDIRTGFDRVLNEDKVVSVERVDPVECRCLTIEEDHSFVYNDLAVHNSMLACVLWPAWMWVRKQKVGREGPDYGGPVWRGQFASYKLELALRDSVKCRALMQSQWYRETFRPEWQFSGDQNVKGYFENTKRGIRNSLSVGTGTGLRSNAIVVDDPISADDALSDQKIEEHLFWWDNTMSNRFNDMDKGVKVIIMQRLSERDLSGHVLARGGYTHLCLPMEFERARCCVTSIGFRDPRTEEGELLFPELFPKPVVEKEKLVKGSGGYAGQYQQRPVPVGGGMIKEHWWNYWAPRGMAEHLPAVRVKRPDGVEVEKRAIELPAEFDAVLQSWDMAFKDLASSDFVVGQVIAAKKAQRFILHQERARMDFPATIAAVKKLSAQFPAAYTKLVEDKANGPAVIQSLHSSLGGFIGVNPIGGKVARAAALSPQIESGCWYLPHPVIAEWVTGYLSEASSFPVGLNDDQVDATTQGGARLMHIKGDDVEAGSVLNGFARTAPGMGHWSA